MANSPFTPEQLVESVVGSGRGPYQSQLPAATVSLLKEFGAHLVNSGKSENTARAYVSWCAKAMAERGAWESHVKSASRAFAHFMQGR